MIDFLVIGGGIAGISIAARLSELGHVVVLEQENALAYHASGRSAAMFEETYGSPSTVVLNSASKDWHLNVNGSKDLPRGLLLLGQADNEDAFAHDLKTMQMSRLSVTDACAMVPVLNSDVISQAAYHAEAWDIDTDAAVQRFARTLRENGGRVVTNARVRAIAKETTWRVEAHEVYDARVVINAAGAWADQVALMAGIIPLGLTPLRRSMARIGAPVPDVADWPMLFGPGETWYAKPDAGALLVSPANESPSEPMDAWADDMELAEGVARYEAHVTEPVTRMIANWAGLRTFAPDRCLALGASEVDGFWWCAGQGGYGFQTAPAASQFLADLIAGRSSDLDPVAQAALNPVRFR